ncbi:MAG: hypothetical protein K2M97_02250 [Muribaculaceae bacterium]|nr:hypothetical protein [Muribaculaceae bacterium]
MKLYKPGSDELAGELEELTVTASKVVFYNKGDTLVYNADALARAEGEMLNALLAKLPGVQMSAGGAIYCNGRKVEKLLINGRDLFNGKRELMLENIAAHTVRNIAVYDKRGRMAELMDLRSTTDKELVMDGRLYREYSIGGTLNAEAGYGTNDRYLGRLFGMWFSDIISFSGYGMANNISVDRGPREEVRTRYVNSGKQEMKRGGLTYQAQDFGKKWEVKGSADVRNKRTDNSSSSESEQYLAGGNLYNYGWEHADRDVLTVSTDHEVYVKFGQRAYMELKPSYSYGSDEQSNSEVKATYRAAIAGLTESDVIGAFESAEPEPDDTLVNRRRDESELRRRTHTVRFQGKYNMKLWDDKFAAPTMLTVNANAKIRQQQGRSNQRYRYNFGDTAQVPILSHLYRDKTPDYGREYSASIGTRSFLQHGRHDIELGVRYGFDYSRRVETVSAYRLDGYGDYGYDSPLTFHPAADDLADLFVPDQSFRRENTDRRHRISLSQTMTRGGWQMRIMPHILKINSELGVSVVDRSFNYFTDNEWQRVRHRSALLNAKIVLKLQPYTSTGWSHNLELSGRENTRTLDNYVNNVSDGLIFYEGDRRIRNGAIFDVRYYARQFLRNKNRRQSLHMYWSISNNTPSLQSYINSTTGAWYFRSYYSGWEWYGYGSYAFSTSFGKGRRWHFETNTNVNVNQSKSRAGLHYTTDSPDFNAPVKEYVSYNVGLDEDLELGWQNDKISVAAIAKGRGRIFTGNKKAYNTVRTLDCNYGADCTFTLPRNWSIGTDMTLYTRRGYLYRSANTTDFVWNARVAKSVLKGTLVFSVEGFDLLHQLNNITYVSTAQSRTVVVHNVVPDYVMIRVQWRFNKSPKK